MAPTLDREPGSGPYEYLAVVQTNGSTSPGDTLFVTAPAIRNNSFHTYNVGHDLHKPEYEVEVDACTRGDHVRLVFTESDVHDGQFNLTRVETAQVTNPSEYETFPSTDLPKQCPVCGDDAIVIIQRSQGVYDEDSVCVVPKSRGRWFGLKPTAVYVH